MKKTMIFIVLSILLCSSMLTIFYSISVVNNTITAVETVMLGALFVIIISLISKGINRISRINKKKKEKN